MSLSVFISHCMAPEDLEVVYEISKQAKLNGIQTYVAERDPKYGESLSDKIKRAIQSSDCMIIFLTKGGAESPWVNQEIGVARALLKPRIPIVEKGVKVRGFDVGKEYIEFDRRNSMTAIKKTVDYLSKIKLEKEQRELTALLIIGGLALLAIAIAASR